MIERMSEEDRKDFEGIINDCIDEFINKVKVQMLVYNVKKIGFGITIDPCDKPAVVVSATEGDPKIIRQYEYN